MGNLLRGIGETPIQPLGISYIDDFAEGGDSSFYLGNVQRILDFMITFSGFTLEIIVFLNLFLCLFLKYWENVLCTITLKNILNKNHIFLASDKIIF